MFPVPDGGVLKVEIVRGHDSAVFAFGNEQRIEQRAGHQGALRGPSWFAGVKHLFGAFDKIGEMHPGTGFLRPEGGGAFAAIGAPPSYSPFSYGIIQRQHMRAKAIAIIYGEKHRLLHLLAQGLVELLGDGAAFQALEGVVQ